MPQAQNTCLDGREILRSFSSPMILTCPACSTRYLVPDTAISAAGRQVRCAKCRHSWFMAGANAPDAPASAAVPPQSPPPVPAPAVPPAAPPLFTPPPIAKKSPDDPAPQIFAAPTPSTAAVASPEASASFDRDESGIDPFAHTPPFKPRTNPTRKWTFAALGAGVLMLGAVGLMQVFGTPSILSNVGLGTAESRLLLQIERVPERRSLPSGQELFAVTGKIINPTKQTQPVPNIVADALDARNKVIYTWVIQPPARSIGPSASLEFNNAELNVPKGASSLKLSFSGR